jgi:hypothetical protein
MDLWSFPSEVFAIQWGHLDTIEKYVEIHTSEFLSVRPVTAKQPYLLYNTLRVPVLKRQLQEIKEIRAGQLHKCKLT